jgi:hypothetical protein
MTDVPLFLGGIIPNEDVPVLKELGVTGIFGPGASMDEIIAFIWDAGGGARTCRGCGVNELLEQVRQGQIRAIARLITQVENSPPPLSRRFRRCTRTRARPTW